MKKHSKMIKKFDARLKAWQATVSDKNIKNPAAFKKPGSRKISQ